MDRKARDEQVMSTPPVLPCPHDAAFECRFVGNEVPPDGAMVVDDGTRRCPTGYLPHRKRDPVVLQGKRVVTGQRAERRPASPGDDEAKPDASAPPLRQP